METKVVTIDLGLRSYDIFIGGGLLYRIADFVPEDLEGHAVFIITDRNVQPYAQKIKDILLEAGAGKAEILTLPPGEQTKSFKQVEKISHWLLDHNVNRDSMIFAVGGGVIGDLAGFCASSILRGIPYVQVPTTLLAQVDSSVGGKTGINMPQGKNLIGSFYQPVAVVADIETFETLPERHVLAGYAEVVKYGLINDSGFFAWLEKNGEKVCALDEEAMGYAIEVSTKAKAAVVQADETEQGQRALLNLGHTFGHALEAVTKYDGRLLHGEAIAIGIVMAFELSFRMGLCKREDLERVEAHFTNIGLPTRPSFVQPALQTNADHMIELMGRDKKVADNKINFILVNGIGEAFITDDVPEDILRDMLAELLAGEAEDSSVKGMFGNTGVRGLWRSAFSSRA